MLPVPLFRKYPHVVSTLMSQSASGGFGHTSVHEVNGGETKQEARGETEGGRDSRPSCRGDSNLIQFPPTSSDAVDAKLRKYRDFLNTIHRKTYKPLNNRT